MATIVIQQHVEVPEPRESELAETFGVAVTPAPRVPKLGWSAPEPEPDGFPLYAVKRDPKSEPEPLSPERAVEMIEAGEAVLADPEEALRAVQDLGRRAQYGPARLRRYEAVLVADGKRRRRERRARALAKAGIGEGENLDPRAVTLWTREDLAAIFDVSTRTIDRWAGTTLPAPLKIGGRRYWRAEAILTRLEAA